MSPEAAFAAELARLYEVERAARRIIVSADAAVTVGGYTVVAAGGLDPGSVVIVGVRPMGQLRAVLEST